MTVVAGIRRGELRGEVRAWDPEAVIVAAIDYHVGTSGHVAGGTVERWISAFVMADADGRRHIFQAHDIAGIRRSPEARSFAAMRLVAVAAGHAGREHFALLE